jgi:uncharacterized protein
MPDWIWDEAKNRSNKAKHGIDFDLAQLVFDDPLSATRFELNYEGEDRWQTIGLVVNTVIFVSHTMSADSGPGRIIGARAATRLERKIYEEGEF